MDGGGDWASRIASLANKCGLVLSANNTVDSHRSPKDFYCEN